jgi:ABC-2 type transport system permease protein
MVYLVLIQKGFQRMLAYRAATLAGLATNFFFGILRAFVFIAVFQASGRATVAGYTLNDAITYTALTQALIAPLYIWSWWEVMRTIKTGEIVSDLTKPFNFYGFWLARDLGRAAFHFLFRGAPILLVYPLFFTLSWPASPLISLLFLISVLLAVLISFTVRFLVNVLAFWLIDVVGIGRFIYFAMTLLSGFIVPVSFFPGWLQNVAAWLPFPTMVNTPIEIFLNHWQGTDVALALAVQLAWFAGLSLLCEYLYCQGTRKLVIQGG